MDFQEVAADSPQDRARAAWEVRWEEERTPPEDFRLSFKAGWKECGAAMEALSSFSGVEVSRWCHDPPLHEVYFACPFGTLQSMRQAVRSTGVSDIKCARRTPSEVAAKGAGAGAEAEGRAMT